MSLFVNIYEADLKMQPRSLPTSVAGRTFDQKMDLLRLRILRDTEARAVAMGYDFMVDKIKTDPKFVEFWQGPKYIKISKEHSVFVFVEKSTEEIFGAKGWSQINKHHQYGSLSTMADWNWGDSYPRRMRGR